MPTFKEASENLGKALEEVIKTRNKLENMEKDIQFARNAHTEALNNAVGYRQALNDILTAELPSGLTKGKIG